MGKLVKGPGTQGPGLWTHLLCGLLIGVLHVLLVQLMLLLLQGLADEASHFALRTRLLPTNQEPGWVEPGTLVMQYFEEEAAGAAQGLLFALPAATV